MLLSTGFSEVFLIIRLKLWVWRRKTTEVQPNLHQRKVMVTVWWSAASLIHYSFLSPSETITSEKYAQQIDKMHENYNAYSWHWSTERAQVFSTTTLECTHHTTNASLYMLNELSFEVLPHPPSSPDLSPTDYHFFKHLDNPLQGKHFYNQQEAENAFQEFI